MSKRERTQYGLQLFGFLRHVLLGFSILLADYSIFWLLDLFRHQLSAEIVARGERHPRVPRWLGGQGCGTAPGLSRLPTAPSTMTISVNGTGYTSEIFQDLVSAFNTLQEGKVSVLSQVCLIEPVEPDRSTHVTIGVQTRGCCTLTAAQLGRRGVGGGPPLTQLVSFPPGILYGVWLFIAIFGSYMARLRRAVCAAYFPFREQVRSPP